MYFLKKTRQAFTLVELSVVIVIISIMLSTVLVSRSLIGMAKVNKIQEEYRSLNAAINIFSNIYDCLPGDCPASSIKDLSSISVYTPVITLCNTSSTAASGYYLTTGTGMIESASKATCAFVELQAAGYISGIDLTKLSTAATLITSTAGTNSITAKFSKQAMWDIRTTGLNNGTGVTATAGATSIWPAFAANTPINWSGLQLVLHSSADTNVEVSSPTASSTTTYTAITGGPTYAVPSSLAAKLDLKFDDGLPYSGTIIGVRNVADANITVSAGAVSGSTTNYACSNLTAAKETALPSSTYSYQSNNSLNFGCIIAYNIVI